MTDGIIQEVFRAYHVNTHNYEYRATVNDINNLIARLQQELIEKIKDAYHTNNKFPSLTLKDLIGDNQE